MAALPQSKSNSQMTAEDYFSFEQKTGLKHEYYNGQAVMMTGASQRHNLITMYTTGALLAVLEGTDCTPYGADMRVEARRNLQYFYPDLSVVCGEAQLAVGIFDTLVNPVIIIEILSPSTEAFDRGDKFRAYRQIESLQNYVLIAQDKPQVECYRRNDDNTWTLTDATGLGASVTLPALACELALADIYRKVSFEAD
jgi:Uma2 family endonuclease